jgi:hypothetical protein
MREARTPRAQTLGRPGPDLSTAGVQLQQPLTIAYRCGELAVCVWVDAIAVGFTGETRALVFHEVVGLTQDFDDTMLPVNGHVLSSPNVTS